MTPKPTAKPTGTPFKVPVPSGGTKVGQYSTGPIGGSGTSKRLEKYGVTISNRIYDERVHNSDILSIASLNKDEVKDSIVIVHEIDFTLTALA